MFFLLFSSLITALSSQLTWKLLNLALYDAGFSKSELSFFILMGWPFQLKIIWAFLFSGQIPSMRALYSRLTSIMIALTALLGLLNISIASRSSLFIFFSGSMVNLASCLLTMTLFQYKSKILNVLNSRQVTLSSKIGRKLTLTTLTSLLILVAHRSSWQDSYNVAIILCALYTIYLFMCLLSPRNSSSETNNQGLKQSLSANHSFLQSLLRKSQEGLDSLRNNISLAALGGLLLVNGGHYLTDGWTYVYLRDRNFSLQTVAGQQLFSMLAYGIGLLYVYVNVNKTFFLEKLAIFSLLYTVTLLTLYFYPSMSSHHLQALLFVKSMTCSVLNALKYAWLISACGQTKDAIMLYGFIMSGYNFLAFCGNIAGGYLMSHSGWPALWLAATFVNLVGVITLLLVDQSKVSRQLRFL